MILIDASNGAYIRGKIEAHDAKLVYAEGGKPVQVLLQGARLTLNAKSSGLTYGASFRSCMQHLSEFANLPPLSADVVRNGVGVAAYFDVESGTFTAGIEEKGAAVAILEVETDGPPMLTITPFDKSPAQTIALPDGAAVQVENIGRDPHGDQPQDFLLHYKIAEEVPGDAKWPETWAGTCEVIVPPFPHNTVGPGCSNSDYP